MAKKQDTPTAVETVTLDVSTLSFGDLETFEDITGQAMFDEDGKMVQNAKALLALAYITFRRNDPDLTLDDVRKMPLSGLGVGGTDPS